MKSIPLFLFFLISVWQLPGEVISTARERFRVEEVAADLYHPWSLAWLPDGTLLATERSGNLVSISGGRKKIIPGLPPLAAQGQGGLLDVAVDPDYGSSPWVYFTYSAVRENMTWLEAARGQLASGSLINLQILWSQNPRAGTRVHYGGRLAFLTDGSLLITTGDRGRSDRAQALADGAGKTVRILKDGRLPRNNPFTGVSGAEAVFTLGHRNIQGLAVHPVTGEIWATEHGPRGGDELNLLKPGLNYGWPVITHGVDYSGAKVGEGSAKPGMEQPVVWWTPSPAPSGLSWYSGDPFPGWKGSLFSGNLAGQHLLRLEVSEGKVVSQEKILVGTVGRIRDVRMGPDGLVYLTTDSPQGKILRLTPLR